MLHAAFVAGAGASGVAGATSAEGEEEKHAESARVASSSSVSYNLTALVALLGSQAQNTQVLYEVGFCLWLLSYNAAFAPALRAAKAVRALCIVIKSLLRVKVRHDAIIPSPTPSLALSPSLLSLLSLSFSLSCRSLCQWAFDHSFISIASIHLACFGIMFLISFFVCNCREIMLCSGCARGDGNTSQPARQGGLQCRHDRRRSASVTTTGTHF